MNNSIFRINIVLAFLWASLLVGGMGLFAFFQPVGSYLETDLMALFPPIEKDVEIENALNRIRQLTDRQVVFLVGHSNVESAKINAEKLASALNEMPGIDNVLSRISSDGEKQWWKLYSPHSAELLSDDLRQLLLEKKGDVWIQQVMAQVYSPFAAVGSEELLNDPLLLVRNFLMSMKQYQNKLEFDDGWLVADNGEGLSFVMVVAELAITPYSLVGSKPLAKGIDNLLKDLEHSDSELQFLKQGTLFYAAHGIMQAQNEISTIGSGSIVGVIFLLLIVFKSLKPFLLSVLSITIGFIFATTTTVLVFGNIHIFTLVIGTSLIGVSIDYSFHYMCEWLSVKKDWQPIFALRRIMPAICMGLITSILAYLVLLLTPFPGLKQLAVFSSTGLLASFLTVILFYPVFLESAAIQPFPMPRILSSWLDYIRTPVKARILSLSLVLLALFSLPYLKTDDDIRQLQATPELLKLQGEQLSTIIGSSTSQQLLIVRGNDDDQVLQKLESITPELSKAVAAGALGNFRSISPLIPSQQRQESDFYLVQDQLVTTWLPILEEKIKLKGLKSELPYSNEFSPLTIDEWLESPASRGWRKLWLGSIGDKKGAVVSLGGVSNAGALKSIASMSEDVYYVSRVDELSELFRSYRVKITALLIASYIAILLLLYFRYGFSKTARIVLAPFLAGATSLSLLSILGLPLNLFGVLGLVLVLGIGIDYTLFMAECREKPVSTLLAVSLSAATTLLSFGLLSLSQTTAIQTFGLVVLVGIFIAFILAPTACDCPHEGPGPDDCVKHDIS